MPYFIPKQLLIYAERFDSAKTLPTYVTGKNGNLEIVQTQPAHCEELPDDLPAEITTKTPIKNNDFIVFSGDKKTVIPNDFFIENYIEL